MPEYRLYPPFLTMPGCDEFADAWEAFCRKLLCLEKGTNDIIRLKAPEGGIDLYYADEKVAYQCKSGKFNVSKASESLKTAILNKNALKWDKYVVCSTDDITLNQLQQLKNIYADVEILSGSHWIGLCETYHEQVSSNFKRLIEVPRSPTGIAPSHISGQTDGEVDLLFYSDKAQSVYKIIASNHQTIHSLLNTLITQMELIPSGKSSINGCDISIHNTLRRDGAVLPEKNTVKDCNLKNSDLIMLHTDISVSASSGRFSAGVYNLITKESALDSFREAAEGFARAKMLKIKIETAIRSAFTAFDMQQTD